MAMGIAPRTLSLWLPPLALMVLIFVLSAMPSDGADRGPLILFARKAAHFTEYALLLALWWRALFTRAAAVPALALAFAIAVAYAATDEFHQTFVDGRVGTPRDVALDAVGAAAAGALILWRRQSRRREVAA